MSKATKKKSKGMKKSNPKRSLEQRRYEYELAFRSKASERIAGRIEKYNEGQKKRDDLIQRLYAVSERQRAGVQKLLTSELNRQATNVKKHAELKKLGVGLKGLGKAVDVKFPKYDAKALTRPLATTTASAKAGTSAKVKKAKSKAKKPETAATASEADAS